MNTKANFIVILMMLCFLSFYSCSLLQQNSSELNAVITEMINNKESFRTGKSEQYGAYIIYITEIERDEKLPDREIVELAFAEGKKKIAEYIGTNFSASESAESLQNNDVLQESFISHIHVDTNQFLRGISLYRFDEIRKNKVRAVVLATEQTQKMISDIKQKMDSVPSDYTASSGFAYIINDRRDQAHEQAIHAALRSAIEQVLGTTVVGHEKVSNINGDITARSRIFAHSDGFIEKYTIIEDSERNGCIFISVYAKVSKDKLLKSYESYLKSFGDPAFCLVTEDMELYQTFLKFFIDLGLKMISEPEKADYLIQAHGQFRAIQHPIKKNYGTQLSLWIRILDNSSRRELLSYKNNPADAAVFYVSQERQREISAEKAFNQMREPLHKALNKMITNMASSGREVSIVLNNYSPVYADALNTLTKSLEQVPGCSNVNTRIDPVMQMVTVTVDYIGKINDLESFLKKELMINLSDESQIPQTTAITANRIDMCYR